MGWSNMGENDCPKKKLEVNMPIARPLLCASTRDSNHALMFTMTKPKPTPIKSEAKKSWLGCVT